MKTSWTDRVRNEEVLQRCKGLKSMLRKIKHGKANWIDPTLPFKTLIEGTERKIEGKGKEGKTRMKA